MHAVVHAVTYVGILAHLAFIPLFAWLGVMAMAWFNVASVALWVGARLANRRGARSLAVSMLAFEVTAHAVAAVSLVGWGSGFHYYLLALVPFVLYDDGIRNRHVVTMAVIISAIAVGLRVTADHNPANLSAEVLFYLDAFNLAVPGLALAVMAYWFRLSSMDIERQLAELAMTDPLTGAPNRRRAMETMASLRHRFERTRAPFSLLLVDLDHFKTINDRYGHDTGDAVLVATAERLCKELRTADMVARWGGEEFLIVLPDTELSGAVAVAEKLRAAIEASRIDCAEIDGGLSISITVGVATYLANQTLDECIGQADEALYRGKEQGRNRVVSAATRPVTPLVGAG